MGSATYTAEAATLDRKKGRLKRIITRGLLFIIAAGVVAHYAYKYTGSNKWHVLPEKDGVNVSWMKPFGSTIVIYKGTTRFKSSLTSITRFMQDPTTCDDVGCTDPVVIKHESPQVQYMSFVYDYDPFDKRQFVVKVDVFQDPKTKVVHVKYLGRPDFVPPEECCVRVPRMNNSWKFTPRGDTEVEVEYIVDMNEGGFLPYFFRNYMHEQTAYIALKEIREFVASDKYRKKYADGAVKLEYIQETAPN